MSNLLLHLSGSKLFNLTVFPPQLYIHDDLLIYRRQYFTYLKEVTISYNQISQITLNKGIFFANVEIVTTGTDDIKIRYLGKSIASRAKKIIDQKIYHSHAKHHESNEIGNSDATLNVERSLSRLKELLVHKSISEREYNKRKKELLSEL